MTKKEATRQTEQERILITLTDRPPVKIVEDDWPIMASVLDWEGQCVWWLIVRQHRTDGRTLVYGICDRCGGELLTPPADIRRGGESFAVWPEIARAIRRVGTHLEMPPKVIADCIADLPASSLEEITRNAH